MGGLDLLPALGRALGVVLCSSCSVVPVLLGSPPAQVVGHRPTPAGGRVALPLGRPLSTDRTRSPLATRRRPPSGHRPGGGPRCPEPDTQAHREREQAQGTLGTADHDTRAELAGANRVPKSTQGPWSHPRCGLVGGNEPLPRSLPGGRRWPGPGEQYPAGPLPGPARPPGPVAPSAYRRAHPPRSPPEVP